MTNTITLQGNWWLPDSPDERLSGILSLSEDRIELNINGQLSIDFVEAHIPEIHGIIVEDIHTPDSARRFRTKIVILQNCLYIKHSPCCIFYPKFDSTIVTSSFSAATAYTIKNHANVKDLSLCFHEIELGFSHLADFSLTTGRLIKDDFVCDENGRFQEISAVYKARDLPRVIIGNVAIKFTQGIQDSGDRIRKFVINPVIRFRITSEEALTLPEWQSKYIMPLKHFLTLATKEVNHVTHICACHHDNVQILDDGTKRLIHYEILNAKILKSRNTEFKEPGTPFFRLRDIQDSFEDILKRWLELYERHYIVQNLLFSHLHSEEVISSPLN
ncbi:hypothetical protein [Roseofilum casamattae]|uniref:ApeA N-terminal domain-containing protein n=1 Tax=Roseofilum casamattae BLCC-M143 TaxID=3022442 RepID=A0ABT7BZI3_9CYAN|nr:hypothetical protein [Roseofilum casamattae]MDJ1184616.1 hypothetical protein [Roseofilum casamattae BLCC-M143]